MSAGLSRRRLLSLAGAGGVAALTGCGTPADGPGTGSSLTSTLPLPARFQTPLSFPPFAGHRGRYLMHCHKLEHEDTGMTANFDVV